MVVEISNLAQTSKSYPLPFETNPQGPPPSPHHLHPSPKAMPFFFRKRKFLSKCCGFLANFGKILKNFKKNWKFLEKIEKYLNQNFSKIFNYEQGKNEKFWKIFLKMSIFWKWFFANISRTVRARAKILVEINPLGHKHTPPDLFPAKNVIISRVWHESKIWSFFNEKKSKNVGFCRKKLIKFHVFARTSF